MRHVFDEFVNSRLVLFGCCQLAQALVAPQGFEPRYAAPEAAVLPLNEGAMPRKRTTGGAPNLLIVKAQRTPVNATAGFAVPYTVGRGQRASTTVEMPPRGRNSPLTMAHTGSQALTTSSSTLLTTFS